MFSFIIATAVIGAAVAQVHHGHHGYHHFLPQESARSSVQFTNPFAHQSSSVSHHGNRGPRVLSQPVHQFDGGLRGIPQ